MKKNDTKIIVIDDEIGIIESISSILGTKYDVVGCTNSAEGLEKIKEGNYDLLILDYFIDDLNGSQVVEKIRKFNDDIYILLLTGYKDSVPALESLENLDIQGYCEKSADFDNIIISIESMVKSIEFSKKNKNSSFSGRLKELRKMHNVSQEDLAKLLGVGRSTIANYESGLSEPTIESVKKIAEYFSVSIDYLFCHSVDYSKSRFLNSKNK